MRRAIAACVLAACSTQGRVDVVVTSPGTDVDTVALFLGNGPGTPDAIVHPDAKLGALSVWWPRDPGNENDVVPMTDGSITFSYQPGAVAEIGALIAVGFAGGKPVAAAWHDHLDIPDGEVFRYPLELAPLSAALNLAVWQPLASSAQPGATCVSYEDAKDTPPKLIVTDGDPDCDGFPTGDPLECLNKVYMGHRSARLDEIQCLTSETIVVPGGQSRAVCELGGPACTDGSPPKAGCLPSRFCLPQSVCEACAASPDSFKCAASFGTNPNVTVAMFLQCDVVVDADGAMCPDPIPAFADATPPYLSGRMCVDKPMISTGDGFSQDAVFPDAKFHIDNLQPSCRFTIEPEGKFAASDNYSVLAVANLDNGRGVGLPIVFSRLTNSGATCGTPTACHVLNGTAPELIDCINAPLP
jgi:hypothetical protein